MKTAFLFAGQGTQHVGMGRDLYESFPTFRAVFDQAAQVLPFDLKGLCFHGPEEQLNDTRYTQPCMVAFAAGLNAVLSERGIRPDCVAGLSLGEYSALCAAGVFTPEQAVRLVAFRGAAMADAVQNRPTSMAAVLHLSRASLEDCCQKAASHGVVEMANFNCPGQIVIGGDEAAVQAACALAKEAGARRCVPLKVSGPFHTSLMGPAAEQLKERFTQEVFAPMQIPVLFNCTGTTLQEGETIPTLLEKQVRSSVYLEDIIGNLPAMGIERVVEIGPGKALSAFVRKTAPQLATVAVETAEDVEALAALWKGESA
jgi:[acyl-carrier-protein] S-malonyltransferase